MVLAGTGPFADIGSGYYLDSGDRARVERGIIATLNAVPDLDLYWPSVHGPRRSLADLVPMVRNEWEKVAEARRAAEAAEAAEEERAAGAQRARNAQWQAEEEAKRARQTRIDQLVTDGTRYARDKALPEHRGFRRLDSWAQRQEISRVTTTLRARLDALGDAELRSLMLPGMLRHFVDELV
jgi:hypothetical protein